jgi:hypothetical protein
VKGNEAVTEQQSPLEKLRLALLSPPMSEAVVVPGVWDFLQRILSEQTIETFYLTANPIGYDAIKPQAQAVVLAAGLLYDFVFGDEVFRYDVVPSKSLTRIEERRELEASLDGEPRHKVVGNMDFYGVGLNGLTLNLVAYGDEGHQLSTFLVVVRRKAFGA